MSLRLKTLATIGAVMLLLFLAVSFVARSIVSERFAVIEQASAVHDAQRLSDALSSRIDGLVKIAGDWAPWDDTYGLVTTGDVSEMHGDLTPETLANLGVNLAAFFDKRGRPVYSLTIDLSNRTMKESSPALVDRLAAHEKLLRPRGLYEAVSGVVSLPEGLMMVAAYPVTTTDRKAPFSGTLVFGKYLDRSEIASLARVTHMSVAVLPVTSQPSPAARHAYSLVRAATSTVSTGSSEPHCLGEAATVSREITSVVVAALDEDRLAAYRLLVDVDGSPAAVTRVTLARTVHAEAEAGSLYLTWSLLLLGVTAIGSTGFVLERYVLRRLDRLSREVAGVGTDLASSGRVTVSTPDELGRLATGVNDMLDGLERSAEDLHAARDDLELRVAERTLELGSSEERYRTLVQGMPDAVVSADSSGRITFANARAAELTGRPAEELLGISYREILLPEDAERLKALLAERAGSGADWTCDVMVRHTGGGISPVELHCSPVPDQHGLPTGTQWIARDLTERKRFEDGLLHLASHDHLTNLMNRRRFEEDLERLIATGVRSGRSGAVLWFDIDGFKYINDGLGHRAGDHVLMAIAGMLRRCTRGGTPVARIGGDEFATLLPEADAESAQAAGQRLLEGISTMKIAVDGHVIRVTASMGIARFPEHGTTAEDVLAKADIAMYYAKAKGGGQLHVHEPDEVWHQELSTQVEWTERISNAMSGGRLLVYAQPLMDLRTDRIARYELLVRLLDEDGKILSPGAFLPSAERLGIIRQIDRYMLSKAIATLAGDDELRLDVNLSGKAFGDADLIGFIEHELLEWRVDPTRLGLDVTETAAIADIDHAREFMLRMRALGCRFSLDDFGSGFSSFYYLKHLPANALKIDGAFVRGIASSEEDQHLVRAMIEVARALSMEAVVEFVEDGESLEIVRRLGADVAQGYHFGQPRPLDEILAERVRVAP